MRKKRTITKKEIPMFVVHNEDHVDPEVLWGDTITCPYCSQKHELFGGVDENGKESSVLLCFKCPTSKYAYLAAVDGRLVIKEK